MFKRYFCGFVSNSKHEQNLTGRSKKSSKKEKRSKSSRKEKRSKSSKKEKRSKLLKSLDPDVINPDIKLNFVQPNSINEPKKKYEEQSVEKYKENETNSNFYNNYLNEYQRHSVETSNFIISNITNSTIDMLM